MPADPPERGPQPRRAALPARRDDTAERLAADREADQAPCGSAGRARRRTARSAFDRPGVPRLALEPAIAAGQRPQRQLGDEDGTGLLQPAGDGGLNLQLLVLVRLGPPGRLVAGVGD